MGYFSPHDPQLTGIKYGNWGSRPFEYFWAAGAADLRGSDVLDIGIGLPSEHTWHEFVRDALQPKTYLGIDIDERIKNEEIDTGTHRVLYMDASMIDLRDNSLDYIFSLSTFEHFEDPALFIKVIAECHRVLRPQGKMIVTLDEFWENNRQDCLPWNELERAWKRDGREFNVVSYGMVDFAKDISKYFTSVDKPVLKSNKDATLLHNTTYNVCVSHGVFEVNK